MRREGIKNAGLTPSAFDYDVNGSWDTTQYHNWQKEFIGRTAGYLDYNASVSGGTNNIQYLVSGTFHRQTTVYPTDMGDERSSLHFNLGSASANERFHLQLTGSYMFDNNNLPSIDLTSAAILTAPNAPPPLNSDGSLNWANINGASTYIINPLVPLFKPYHIGTNNLVSNLLLSYQLFPGLKMLSSFGYTAMTSNESLQTPLSSIADSNKPTFQRQVNFLYADMHSWIIEPQLNYQSHIAKGKLEVLVGGTVNQQFTNGNSIVGFGQNSDQVLLNISAAPSATVTALPINTYKYASGFGRLNYNWADKYILSTSIRRDGSSRFGPANRFANFWSASGAWLFSEESLIKKNLTWLSLGKLRASYGTTGSDQIPNYLYMNLYNVRSVTAPYQNVVSIFPNGLTNPTLQWNVTKKFEASLMLGLLKDRVIIESAFFQNRSSNQYGTDPLPIITGFTGITKNLPIVFQQKGWEFSLNTINVKSKDISWSTNFNISFVRNKVIAFPQNLSAAAFYVVGNPAFGYQPVFHYSGVDPATGLYQFSDGKGGVTTSPEANPALTQTEYVNLTPKFYGGFQNTMRYKSFSLDVLLQFNKQLAQTLNFGNTTLFPGRFNTNQPAWLFEQSHWIKAGDIATYRAFSTSFSTNNNFIDVLNSNSGFEDASFIRAKNISLRWQLPDTWVRKVHFQDAVIFINGQNLFTITKYRGLDPESLGTGLPPLRVITFGAKLTL